MAAETAACAARGKPGYLQVRRMYACSAISNVPGHSSPWVGARRKAWCSLCDFSSACGRSMMQVCTIGRMCF